MPRKILVAPRRNPSHLGHIVALNHSALIGSLEVPIHPLSERKEQYTAYPYIQPGRHMHPPSEVLTEIPDEVEAFLISGRCSR
jgi:hypothetical protein